MFYQYELSIMTMKSVYIVYITNCFLWTMSDNKTYLMLSYLNTLIGLDEDLEKCSEPDQANVLEPSDEFVSVDSCFIDNSEPEAMHVDSNLIIRDKQKFAGGDATKSDYQEPINNDLNASQDDVISNDEAEPSKVDSMHSQLELSGDTAYNTVGEQQQDTNKDQKRSAPALETGYLSYMLTGVLAREKDISSQQAVFHIDNIARHEVSWPITSTGNVNRGLLLEDTLGCQWSGGEVCMFLKRILRGLPIALHGGFCLFDVGCHSRRVTLCKIVCSDPSPGVLTVLKAQFFCLEKDLRLFVPSSVDDLGPFA